MTPGYAGQRHEFWSYACTVIGKAGVGEKDRADPARRFYRVRGANPLRGPRRPRPAYSGFTTIDGRIPVRRPAWRRPRSRIFVEPIRRASAPGLFRPGLRGGGARVRLQRGGWLSGCPCSGALFVRRHRQRRSGLYPLVRSGKVARKAAPPKWLNFCEIRSLR